MLNSVMEELTRKPMIVYNKRADVGNCASTNARAKTEGIEELGEMDQPLQPPLPQSGKQSTPLQEASDPTPGMFWRSFNVFLSPLEAFCVQRWYIFGLAYFVVEFVTAFITDIAVGAQYQHDLWFYFKGGNFPSSMLYYFLTVRLIFNVFISGFFLALGLTDRWQRSIPRFFHILEQRSPLNASQSGLEKSYQDYLAQYRHALLYGKGRVLTRPVAVGVVFFCSLITLSISFAIVDIPFLARLASQGNNVVTVLTRGIWQFELDFFYPLYLMYLATSIIWMLGATGLYVRQFVGRFPLRIQLAHPDSCGGFKFLGDFALAMALVVLAAATLLALFSIWRGYSLWSFGTSILVLFLLIVSYGAFFAPVLAVHKKMLKERNAYEDAVATRAARIEEHINEALKSGDVSRLKTAKEELDVVQALFPDAVGYPYWPFNWRILITFFSSQLIPIISFVAGISPTAFDFLARLFSFLSGRS